MGEDRTAESEYHTMEVPSDGLSAQYAEHGYVVVRDLIPSDRIDAVLGSYGTEIVSSCENFTGRIPIATSETNSPHLVT